MMKRTGLLLLSITLLTLIAGAVYAGCALTGTSFFNVYLGGSVTITNSGDSTGKCAPLFYGFNLVNAATAKFTYPGTCANSVGTSLVATNLNVLTLSLPVAPIPLTNYQVNLTNTSQYSLGFGGAYSGNWGSATSVTVPFLLGGGTFTKSGNTVTVPAGLYSQVQVLNGMSAVLNAGTTVNSLTVGGCNGAGVTFGTGGAYFINSVSHQAGCNMFVGSSVTSLVPVNLYVNSLDLKGGPTCINYVTPGVAGTCTTNSAVAGSQHPELMHIYVNQGNVNIASQVYMAAGLYVAPTGSLTIASGQGAMVGEVAAQTITVGNSSTDVFYYMSTGILQSILPALVSTHNGYYSLTAPAISPATKTTGSYAYVASQTDQTLASLGLAVPVAGTSGHLQAFPINADGTLSTTATWDAATLMTPQQRSRLIDTDIPQLDGSLPFSQLFLTPLNALGPTVGLTNQLLNCIIYPDYNNGVCLSGRDPTSMVGEPQRTQPIIVDSMVIFAANDGILYAVDKTTGALKWGWMPWEFLLLEGNLSGLLGTDPWGQISTVFYNGTRYVMGTGNGGLMHFCIALNADGSLGNVVWDDEELTLSPASPAGGAAPAPLLNNPGVVTYIVGNQVVQRNVADANGVSRTTLPLLQVASSNLVPLSSSEMYYGDTLGYVRGFGSGIPDPGYIGILEPVLGVNETSLTQGGVTTTYLVAYSNDRVAVFGRPTNGSWTRLWYTSALGGASTTTGVNVLAWTASGYVSALPGITSNLVFIPITVGTTICTQSAYSYGPVDIASGGYYSANVAFNGSSITSVNNYLGLGESEFLQSTLMTNTTTSDQELYVVGFAGGGNGGSAGGSSSPATGWNRYNFNGGLPTTYQQPVSLWRELGDYVQ